IYWRRLLDLLTGFAQPERRDYLVKLGTSFLITAALGLVVAKLGFELPETVTPVAWALILGGFWIFVAEWLASKQEDRGRITWTVAIVGGLAQIAAASFPGLSRAGAPIFAAMLCGTGDRRAAAEYSFLVGIPTMYAASGYALLK